MIVLATERSKIGDPATQHCLLSENQGSFPELVS